MSRVIKLSSSAATRGFWEIPILFEDGHLLALDKPGGLLCSPDPLEPNRPSLMGLLHQGIAEAKNWAGERQMTYLMNAHRPDDETSGILLLAKSKPVLISLANLFGSEQPGRRHLTLVQGSPAEESFEVDVALGPHPVQPGLMRVDPKRGKKARTRFKVLERFAGWALLECELLTDRPHQIRVHLRHARLPVAGDASYGGRPLLLSKLKPEFRLKPGREERPLVGQAIVHATELDLVHPVTGAPIEIRSPWPKDLSVAVKYLRRYAL